MSQPVAGVLLHITSLPSRFPCGSLGASAHTFLDWMIESGLKLWQTLPLHPIDGALSPYSSTSAFAGAPHLIDLDILKEQGWLTAEEISDPPTLEWVSGDLIQRWLLPRIKLAAQRFSKAHPDRIQDFVDSEDWVEDWAHFQCLLEEFDVYAWQDFPAPLRDRDPAALKRSKCKHNADMNTQIAMQIFFFEQWDTLTSAARTKGITLVGDLPIFVSSNGVDTWVNRPLFHLDEDGHPNPVAGVPPDVFSEDGQHWGNPLYNWEAHEAEGFAWWIKRLEAERRLTDQIRIDHFRGFAAAWGIPRSAGRDAKKGAWIPAKGIELFEALRAHFGDNLPFFAEDLGIITEDVDELRTTNNLMGMKILQFAFTDDDHIYQPHMYDSEQWVCYTGTHDNNTTIGWYNEADESERHRFRVYTGSDGTQPNWAMLSLALSSKARWVIVPMQDFIDLDATGRMNTPGQAHKQWGWRLDSIPFDVCKRIQATVRHFNR